MVFSSYTFNLTPSQVLKNKEKMKHLHFSSYTSCCCDAVSANVMCYNEAAADDHSLLPVRLLWGCLKVLIKGFIQSINPHSNSGNLYLNDSELTLSATFLQPELHTLCWTVCASTSALKTTSNKQSPTRACLIRYVAFTSRYTHC